MIRFNKIITLLGVTLIASGCPTSFVPLVDDLVIGEDSGTHINNPINIGTDGGVQLVPDSGVVNPPDSGSQGPTDTGVALIDPQRLDLEIIGSSASSATINPGNIECFGQCQLDFEKGTLVTINLVVATSAELIRWTGDCTGNGNPCQLRMDQSRVVKARLTAVQKSLTVNLVGAGQGIVRSMPPGINCGSTCTDSFDMGSSVTLIASAAPGSEFDGWSGACSGTGDCTFDISANAMVTARFNKQQVTLTTVVNGNGNIESTPAGINCGTDCAETYDWGTTVSLEATPDTNFTFASWTGACAGNGTCTVVLDADKEVTAEFTDAPVSLDVTLTGNGRGSVTSNPMGISCPGACQTSFSQNQTVTLTAQADPGSRVENWSGPCAGSGNTCTLNLANSQNVSVEFALETYMINVMVGGSGSTPGGTISSVPSGISCGTVCSASYNYGTSVTLRAQARTEFQFDGWTGDCTGTTPECIVTVDQVKNIVANFSVKTHDLTVIRAGSSPNGGRITSLPGTIDCGSQCTDTFDYGQDVDLRATALTGYEFENWTGDCATAGSNIVCRVQMTADRTASARFKVQRFPLLVSLTGSQANDGFVSSTVSGISCPNDCEEEYDYNTQVTLTALANNGATFARWGGACAGSGSSASCTVTMDQAQTVTAQFDTPSFELTVSTIGSGGGHILSTPVGIDCPGTCNASFASGTTVTLLPTPDASSGFSGWTADCSGAGTCNVTMNSTQRVTAEFEDGLVAFYALDGDVIDNSRNGHDGTNNGTQSTAGYDGVTGSAMAFTFSNNVDVLSDPALSGFDEMTICAWVYSNTFIASTTYIASKVQWNSGTGSDDAYALLISGSRRPQFFVSTSRSGGDTDNTTVEDSRNNYRVSATTWKHICGVYDGQDASVYTDGSFGDNDGIQGQINQTSSDLRLGRCTSNSQFNCTSSLNGRIDNLKLYNRALDATEIQQEYSR